MAGAGGPVVILIAPPPPQQDPQLLQEALKFNAFSVLSEPVDVNTALEVMARAMKRFHQGMWPS
jgi:AmiR/NasT family two-component response regulator